MPICYRCQKDVEDVRTCNPAPMTEAERDQIRNHMQGRNDEARQSIAEGAH